MPILPISEGNCAADGCTVVADPGKLQMKVVKQLWRRWLSVARKIGEFQSRVVLTIFYFTFAAPFALGVKVFSDPLRLKRGGEDSYWVVREPEECNLDKGRRQF